MKQMSRNRILALALCLALVAAVLVYVFLSKQRSRELQEVYAVAAGQDIPARAIIERGMVEIRSFQAKELPAGYFSNADFVVGKVALEPVTAGQAISQRQVAAKGAALGLSYAVPPFMRAVTVALDPIIGVAGFLKPGDHVDVVATFNVNNGTLTKTVLQDVALLATGSEVVEPEIDPGTGKPAKPKVQPNATLAVTPEDAEKLILAESKGTLRLALRPVGEASYVRSRGITSRALLGVVPPDVPERRAAAPAPRPVPAAYREPIMREAAPVPFGIGALPGPIGPPETGKRVQIVRGTKIEEAVVTE